jgi:hypothetical protein
MSTDTANRAKWRGRRLPFVLVYLLVAFLGAVLLVVALQETSDRDGRRRQAVAEIRQIESAVGLFNAKFMTTYPAASGGGPNGEFRLCSRYADADGNWLDWPEVKYLKEILPLMDRQDNGLRWNGQPVTPESPRLLDANQSLVFFLTGGPFTKYQGLSKEKQRPLAVPGQAVETRDGPFLDFPLSRYDADGRVLDPWGTPLAYFTAVPGSGYSGSFTWNGSTVRPYREPGDPDRFMNRKTFQLISAGRNRVFGPGGNWTPGEGEWAADGPGGGDPSNFNNGPLSRRNE